MDLFQSIQKFINEQNLEDATIKQLIEVLQKDMKRIDFAIKRMQWDKSITENFLNTTIQELELANAQLKVYQEKELEEKERTIRLQESQLKQITDAMPSSLAFVDPNYCYRLTNRSYITWFGKDQKELEGKHISSVIGVTGFHQNKPHFDKALAGEAQSFERIFKDKHKNDLVFNIDYVPAYDADQKIIGVYVYAQDITEQKQKEKAIEDKNKELQKYIKTNLQLENFTYLASHDLRSPMINMRYFIQLLKEETYPHLAKQEQKYLDFIDKDSRQMQSFIDDLLAHSLTINKSLELQNIITKDLLNEVLKTLKNKIENANAHINIRHLPKTITGDPLLLKQLFYNLINNSIKFVKPDNNPEISINCFESTQLYTFSVSDNGIGIAKSLQNKIFGIFKRLHLRSEYEGTGIGLASCKNIIEKHKGKIWLESEEGKGSTFFFTLPKQYKL